MQKPLDYIFPMPFIFLSGFEAGLAMFAASDATSTYLYVASGLIFLWIGIINQRQLMRSNL